MKRVDYKCGATVGTPHYSLCWQRPSEKESSVAVPASLNMHSTCTEQQLEREPLCVWSLLYQYAHAQDNSPVHNCVRTSDSGQLYICVCTHIGHHPNVRGQRKRGRGVRTWARITAWAPAGPHTAHKFSAIMGGGSLAKNDVIAGKKLATIEHVRAVVCGHTHAYKAVCTAGRALWSVCGVYVWSVTRGGEGGGQHTDTHVPTTTCIQ